MLVKEHPNPSNFGVVMLEDGCVTRIIEKPEHAPSFMVSTGIYSLKKDFFSKITEMISLMQYLHDHEGETDSGNSC